MKKMVIIVVTIAIIILALSVFGAFSPNKEASIDAAYIVDDSTVTVFKIGTEEVHIPVHPGGYMSARIIKSFQIHALAAERAYEAGITKPGLDFTIFSGGWGNPGEPFIEKSDVMHNTIYIEKEGKIYSLQNLYVNSDSVIRYRIINKLLDVKKLSAVEVYDLPEDIRNKIAAGEEFIISKR